MPKIVGILRGQKSRSEVRPRDLLFRCSAQQNAVFDKKLNSNRLSRSRVSLFNDITFKFEKKCH